MPGPLPEPSIVTLRRLGASEVIYAAGDENKSYFKVVSGMVRTCNYLADGRRQIDTFYSGGDFFGFETARTHWLTAESVGPGTVCCFRRYNHRAPDLSSQLLDYTMRCFTRAQQHSLVLGRHSAAEKMAAFLIEIADRNAGAALIEFSMSRQDIGDYLGLTVETISRMLSQFERDGLIKLVTSRRIAVTNRAALDALNS
jgi:CRP/FNR family nitrogen fixation transcriptional regulator